MIYLKSITQNNIKFTLFSFEYVKDSTTFNVKDWPKLLIDLLHLKHNLIITSIYKESFELDEVQLNSKAHYIDENHLVLMARSKHYFKDFDEKLDNFPQLAQFLRKKLKK